MQSTLGNICSGLAIQMQRPFEVGDWIQFDDQREHIGKVREINWRATTAVTLDDVEAIIRQGDEGSELFVVQAGEVAVSVRGNSGQDAELQRLGPGDFFGEMSLLAGDRRAATVRTTTDCELLVIDKPALAAVFESAPELVEVVSSIVAGRIAEKSARLAELPAAVAAERESLVMRAKRYFGIR